MKRLHNTNRIPHGGSYVLNLPERGLVGSGMNFAAIVRSISEWRRANSIPVGLGFESEVEQALCSKYEVECDDTVLSKPRKARLSLSTVLSGTKVLLAFKLAGSPYVTQEEANRRAATCSMCAWNQDYTKPCGGACGGLKEIVSQIIGNKTTPYDDKLKSCGVCSCFAAAHIWLPLNILENGVSSDQREQFAAINNCWKKI